MSVRDNSGFTLMEVLVSIAILSIGIVSIIQLFSQSLKSTHQSKLYSDAIFHARQKMDEVLTSWDLEEGMMEGEFEGNTMFLWEVSVTPDESMDYSEGMNSQLITWLIYVKVKWREGLRDRYYDLTTLKTMVASEGGEGL